MNKHIPHILTLFLAVVSAAGAVHAQPTVFENHRLPAFRGLPQLTTAKTTAIHRAAETIHLTMQDLNWINESRTRNVFEDGLLREQYQDVWEGEVFGEWREQTLTTYAYAGGTLSELSTYRMSDAGWLGLTRLVYGSQNGIYTQILSQAYENGAWVDQERTSYTLAGGHIAEGFTEHWDGTWTPAGRFTIAEEDGDVIATYQVHDGTGWVNTERYTYEDLTIAQLYDLQEQYLNHATDYEGLYVALRFPDVVAQGWDGSGWVNDSRQDTEVFYDLWTGYIAKELITTEVWMEGAWVSTSRSIIDYANETEYPGLGGLPGRTTVQFYDGTEWVDFLVEKYIIQNDIRRVVQATIETNLGAGLQETAQVRIEWTDVSSGSEHDETPRSFELAQNAPNPFNPSTSISFRLSESKQIRLAIYDMLGREVAVLEDGFRPAGEHRLSWDASSMPSGVYLYRIEAGAESQTRQMILVK